MIQYVNPGETAGGDQREIAGLTAPAAVSRLFEGSHHGPFG